MSAAGDLSAHWDSAYRRNGETAVSWYAPMADAVPDLLDRLAVPRTARILDAGGGASVLVDELLGRGFEDLTVLDLSGAALDAARRRLGVRSQTVSWVVGDVRTWRPRRRIDVWHDRAVLHFQVDEQDRAAYLATLRACVAPGGLAVLSTFAPGGPEQCSNLPVRRYDAADLAALLPDFAVLEATLDHHRTPWDAIQPFTRVALRRNA